LSRDYKPSPQKQKPEGGKGSSLVTGILIGLILGIGLSVGVAIFVKGGGSPFQAKNTQSNEPIGPNLTTTNEPDNTKKPDTPDVKTPAKPRFDFYTILPGKETQVTEQEIKQTKGAQQSTETVSSENYFLQVGAYQTEQEADNLKAKLALLGMEAVIQTANIEGKGVWHRVRVGPFTDLDQINKARGDLGRNGFNSDLIKIHSSLPDQ
jgi:cell division protein FtsN